MTEIIPSSAFEDLIKNSDKPVLVDVFADWCGPCHAIAPVIDQMSKDLKDKVRIVKIDRDEADANGGADNPVLKLMAEKGVRGIPALLLFEGGEFKGSLIGGPRPRSNIQGWIEKTLDRSLSGPAPASGNPGPSAPSP